MIVLRPAVMACSFVRFPTVGVGGFTLGRGGRARFSDPDRSPPTGNEGAGAGVVSAFGRTLAPRSGEVTLSCTACSALPPRAPAAAGEAVARTNAPARPVSVGFSRPADVCALVRRGRETLVVDSDDPARPRDRPVRADLAAPPVTARTYRRPLLARRGAGERRRLHRRAEPPLQSAAGHRPSEARLRSTRVGPAPWAGSPRPDPLHPAGPAVPAPSRR